jgi:hypothetical protein
MEGMWKEITVTNFKILSQNSLGGTNEDHENTSCLIADLREKIRNCDLPTVKQKH